MQTKKTAISYRLLLGLLAFCVFLTACGFKMRGQTDLPYKTVYANISRNTSFGIYIYRLLKASSPDTVVVDDAKDADIIITQLSMNRNRTEVSLDADGKVEEYELGISLHFTVTDNQGNVLIEPSSLDSTQLLPYDEDVADAKNAEMSLMYSNMEKNIADRLYRRLISESLVERYRYFNPQ
ncbi:hypothetical protein F9B74_06095 [Pelistega sp. NLN82]|uniref:LPS-assembly lipoprotein LptE n=1 Tax=Pelistega ratti TaxID=2652177 RepID=A0A6L9Y7T2_9BURK|nr:LPS assembly lipoprotein LptE [Pelistega ratti]NEN75897.1 hypothetical protein [Pelistega ratti]